MGQTFGDWVTYYRARKHGLSQGKLAALVDIPSAVLSKMCRGQRLTGQYARERVLRVILGLLQADALHTAAEAATLLQAAAQPPLAADELPRALADLQRSRSDFTLPAATQAQIAAWHLAEAAAPPDTPRRFPAADLHLPAPDYAQLFGVQDEIARLTAQLRAPDGPRFLSLEGLGGVGKTALARAVAQTCAETGVLADVVWISARQEWLSETGELTSLTDPARSLEDIVTRLTLRLNAPAAAGLATAQKLAHLHPLAHSAPYLIVIDNLETLADVAALLPALYPLAGVTRFLLTSRRTLRHFPYVHVAPVTELSFASSCALVAHEWARRGQTAALPATFAADLYHTVGGLPLALKLATAQVGCLPLADIVTGLQQARQAAPDRLYAYIYRRTWGMLSAAARQILVYGMLSLDPEGEDLEFIQAMSAVPPEDFAPALRQLLEYALLELGQPLAQPRYRLHRLTTTFLQTDVLQRWETSPALTAEVDDVARH